MTNPNLKRDPVKYVRDSVKAQYVKGTECRICRTSELLEFHHFYSVAELWHKWVKTNGIVIATLEDILEARDKFIAEHTKEMLEDAVTLCKKHHMGLHRVYGKNPALSTAEKQVRWVEKQREKLIPSQES